MVTALGKKGKARKEETNQDQASPTNPTPPRPPKRTIQCALCDIVGHATHTCPELPHLKALVNETFPESDLPEVYVTIPDSIPKLKTLCTNHPCALCDFHGHYTHLCPRLDEYHSSLDTYHQFKATHDKIPSHLSVSSTSIGPEYIPTPIHIPPPAIEPTEPSITILYLSSSLRDNSPNLQPINSLGSPSVDLGSADVA